MKRSFFLSLFLHSIILIFLSIGFFLHQKRGIEIPNDTAVIVNFVKIGPRSQAPIIGQPSQRSEPSSEQGHAPRIEQKPPISEHTDSSNPSNNARPHAHAHPHAHESSKQKSSSSKKQDPIKSLPEKGDIAKKQKNKVSSKLEKRSSQEKQLTHRKNHTTHSQSKEKALPNTMKPSLKEASQQRKGQSNAQKDAPKYAQKDAPKDAPKDAQRADTFGLEITTTQAALIKAKLDTYWTPPEIAENSGVKIRVFMEIDSENGCIKNYRILERMGPQAYYDIFERRIAFVLNNPEINFSDLDEETRNLLGEKGLEVIFDADTTDTAQ